MIVMEAKKEVITQSEQVSKVFYSLLKQIEDEFDKDVEHFWVAHLDSGNKVVLVELISMGTVNGTAVSPKRVFQRAVQTNRVTQIIACHNHPSGNLRPSREDKSLTNKIKKAGEVLVIPVLDHVVIGNTDMKDTEYYSFADSGLM